MTSLVDHNAEKSRSYAVRQSLPGALPGRDWSQRMSADPVFVVARRDSVCRDIVAGESYRLISTSNAGFNGITAMARLDDGTYQHLGSLGAYDVETLS